MATVHIGRLRGPAGFARTVAIKRLHPPFARDPEFVSMFLDEARLAARIQHPNVVSVLDVVASEGELFLVMDYVHGESLSRLLKLASKASVAVPRRIFVTVLVSVLSGLHAAHEARSERGDALEIVHRDVSPQNVLLGLDGVARVLDFGVAKASLRVHWSTKDGQLKGKLGYMAPEQITTGLVDRRADIYAVGVMLWEGLTGKRLFDPKQQDVGALLTNILNNDVEPPSKLAPGVPKSLDAVVLKALARSREERYATAHDMAEALERAVPPASSRQVGEWVAQVAGPLLRSRAAEVTQIERAELPAPPTGRTSDFRGLIPTKEDEGSDSGSLPRPDTITSIRDAETLSPPPVKKDKGDLSSLVPKPRPPVTSTPVGPPSGDEEEILISGENPLPNLSEVDALDDKTVKHDPEPDEAPTLLREAPNAEASGVVASKPLVAESISPPAAGIPPPLVSKAWARKAWPFAAALGGLVLLGWLLLRPSRGATAHVAASSASTKPAPEAVLPPPPPPASAIELPDIDEAPSATATASAVATAAARPTATAVRHVWHPPPVKKNDCDPPYTIDAQGVRIPKRHCM